jgi:biofilm protein TabA
MVVDRLENIEKYASLNPLFAQAIEFLKSHDLNALEVGKTELKGKDLLVNVAQTKPKQKKMPSWKLTETLLTSRYLYQEPN